MTHELAKIIRVELIKTKAGENCIKVQLYREDESITVPKDRYGSDWIKASSPDFVIKRWWSLLGYESASWESFFNQDVFDLIGLNVLAEFEKKDFGWCVKKVESTNGSSVPSSTPPPPPPSPTTIVTSQIDEDDGIPF